MNLLFSKMLSNADPSQVEGLARFFKTGPGQYGEGDKFLGIKVPVTRSVVKDCWREVDFPDLEECLESDYHEVRLAALLALVEIFSHAKKDPSLRHTCVDFYLAHTDRINNWDLVDLSCYLLLGEWLLDKDRTLLYELARNGKTIWEQRIGIVSTMTFVRHGQTGDTFAIADILLHHPHDLIHKAVGWLLREAGKKDKRALVAFLKPRYHMMPRTMLRYAIEKFPPEERTLWMKSPGKLEFEGVSLETDRILLRPWLEKDAEALFKYASDPEVGPRAGWAPHKSIDESLGIIRSFFHNDHTWAMELKETGEPIGCIGYMLPGESNIPIGPEDVEAGYWVARPYWNQGLCTEALRRMIDYCFCENHFRSIWSDFFVNNPASGRVMEKCGFIETGAINWCSHLYQGDKAPVKVMRLDNNL